MARVFKTRSLQHATARQSSSRATQAATGMAYPEKNGINLVENSTRRNLVAKNFIIKILVDEISTGKNLFDKNSTGKIVVNKIPTSRNLLDKNFTSWILVGKISTGRNFADENFTGRNIDCY